VQPGGILRRGARAHVALASRHGGDQRAQQRATAAPHAGRVPGAGVQHHGIDSLERDDCVDGGRRNRVAVRGSADDRAGGGGVRFADGGRVGVDGWERPAAGAIRRGAASEERDGGVPAGPGGPPHQRSGLSGHRPQDSAGRADKDNRRNPLTTSIGADATQPLVLPPTAPPMRVLAAEDNPVFQSMLKTMLTKWGYQPVIARSGTEAWRGLESEDAPRLAVLDWMMPGMDGVEICRRVRSANREPYIYILLLTARTDSQDLIEGMDAGADDYLTKPFNAHELRVRLNAGRRILNLQAQLLKAREALREQATHDGLTGLLNRSRILETLDDEISRAARTGQPVSVVMADLDGLKAINDCHGHLAGAAVLREAAPRLKSSARRYDSVGRYGGEEFLILPPGRHDTAPAAQAERMRVAIGATPILTPSQPLAITASLGVSCSSSCPPETLVRQADDALYA